MKYCMQSTRSFIGLPEIRDDLCYFPYNIFSTNAPTITSATRPYIMVTLPEMH